MHAGTVAHTATRAEAAGLSLFSSGERQAAAHIAAIGSLQRKSAGEIVFAEGEETGSVYEVVRGMLRLYKLLPDGRRQITGFLSAGHLLGLAPEGAYVFTAEAVTDVTLCRYGRAAFERFIDEVPGFAKKLLAATSHELRLAQEQMLLLGRKTAAEKVATFLLLIAENQEENGQDGTDLLMSRQDIADYLGLTIETVSRTLTKLKHDGLIALPTPARVEIRDRSRLEDLAAGEGETN
jgi:CRP/FNR family transcriptional regulator